MRCFVSVVVHTSSPLVQNLGWLPCRLSTAPAGSSWTKGALSITAIPCWQILAQHSWGFNCSKWQRVGSSADSQVLRTSPPQNCAKEMQLWSSPLPWPRVKWESAAKDFENVQTEWKPFLSPSKVTAWREFTSSKSRLFIAEQGLSPVEFTTGFYICKHECSTLSAALKEWHHFLDYLVVLIISWL